MIKNVNLQLNQPVSFQKKQQPQVQSFGSLVKNTDQDSFKRIENNQVTFKGMSEKEKNICKLLQEYNNDPSEDNLKKLVRPDVIEYVSKSLAVLRAQFRNPSVDIDSISEDLVIFETIASAIQDYVFNKK